MKIEYDKEVDAAYLYLLESEIVDSDEIAPGIVYDFDKDDRIVGIEILSIKRKNPSEIIGLFSDMDSPLSLQQQEEFKEFFRKVPALA